MRGATVLKGNCFSLLRS